MSNYLVVCKQRKYKNGDGKEQTSLSRVGAFFPFKEGNGGRMVLDEGIAVFGELVMVEPRDSDG